MKRKLLAIALLSIAAVVHAEPNPAKQELIVQAEIHGI